MTAPVFAPPAAPEIPLADGSAAFPVRRIFCVGQNYRDHQIEMGNDPERTEPTYFTKAPAAYAPSGGEIPYPPGTSNLHHEIELVLALGAGGLRVSPDAADALIFGYAAGLDMTRRDLQAAAKERRQSWDLAKDFENAAIVGAIRPKADAGDVARAAITLWVNGAVRQSSTLDHMIWSPAEILANLSQYYHLAPGDLVFTGTPAGVGPVVAGDLVDGAIDGVGEVSIRYGAAA